jgi:hypothetical protein
MLELLSSYIIYLINAGYENEILMSEKSNVLKILKMDYLTLLQEKHILYEENGYFQALTETVSQEEKYLIVNTRKNKAYLKLKNAILNDMDIVLTAFNKPLSDTVMSESIYAVPKGIIEVQSKETHPTWYNPNFIYSEKKSQFAEPNSKQKNISGTLGEYALYLGGGIVIHGIVSKDVPPEALNFISIQMETKSLKTIYNSLDLGSRVFIQ